MKDKLYEEFYDPSEDFLHEPRAFCYEIASNLIKHAKKVEEANWYNSLEVVKSILLLLYTWNFAAKETKKLNFENIGKLINDTKDNLCFLEKYNILNIDDNACKSIETIFDQFRILFGQTGASKALSLLNPELFVMWDTMIRYRLRKELIPGIMNGERGEHYVTFLKGIRNIIEVYRLQEKLPDCSVVAKKIDEYNYVRIVMNVTKKHGIGEIKSEDKINNYVMKTEQYNKIHLPDNLKGRSIYEKVIPTVCNLKNMLKKLKQMKGDDSKLKPFELRSYKAYRMDQLKAMVINYQEVGSTEKEIIKMHILQGDPTDFGASCIDIYLVAYVSANYGPGKENFFKFIKDKGISNKQNVAQAIWQVGKGDGVFLDLLNKDGTIKDKEFFVNWARDSKSNL